MVEEKKKAGYVLLGSVFGTSISTVLVWKLGVTEPSTYMYVAVAGTIAGGLLSLLLMS